MDQSLNFGLEDTDVSEDPNPNHEVWPMEVKARHLENDDFFEEPIVPGEVPKLDEDKRIIAANLDALEDLILLARTVNSTGGMCQAFATEAKRLDETFDKGYPIGYYTKHVSATRFQASLESLAGRIWEKIKKIFKGIVVLIAVNILAFTDKILGKRNSNQMPTQKELERDAQDSQERLVKNQKFASDSLEEIADAAISVENEIKKGATFQAPTGEVQLSDFDRVIGEYIEASTPSVREFMTGGNPLFVDIVEDGPFTQLLMFTAGGILPEIRMVTNKAELLLETITNVVKEGSASLTNQPRIADILMTPTFYQYDGKKLSFIQFSALLRQKESDLLTGPHRAKPYHIQFSDVFNGLAKAYDTGVFSALVRLTGELLTGLIRVRGVLYQALNVVTELDIENANASEVDWFAVIRSIQEDVNGLTEIVSVLEKYRDEVTRITLEAVTFGGHVALLAQKRLTPEQINPRVASLIEELRKTAEDKRRKFVMIKAIKG